MKFVADACLLIEVNAEGVSQITRAVQNIFEELGIQARPSPQSHHISIGYTVGDFSIDHLKDVAKEIAEKPFSLTFVGIEILKGLTTDQDYVVLKVGENQDLEYAVGLIAENAPTRTFHGGFKTHLSLLTVDQGTIVDCETVARYLELKVLGLMSDIKLVVDGISIFSKARERVAQIPFTRAI